MKAKLILRQAKNGTVLNNRPIVLAQTSVKRLTDRTFHRIPRHNAINQPQRVLAADIVFVKRRDIEQRGGIPNGVVLIVVHDIVGAGNEITRPSAPILAHTKRRSSRDRKSTRLNSSHMSI